MDAPLLDGFAEWLAVASAGRLAHADPDTIHAEVCSRLHAMGLPLWRSNLMLDTLHPVDNGGQSIWRDGTHASSRHVRVPVWGDNYLLSPIRIVDETAQPFRSRLEGPFPDMPLLAELAQQGATDYVAVPLPFLDFAVRTATISFATQRPGGFGDADMARLLRAAQVLGPVLERTVTRQIALNLLDTYVGPRSGAKVFAGQIDRDAVTRIDAAILFGDLRNFTALSNAVPPEAVIALLDDWFDMVDSAVAAQGGEVLKFIGDGVLAIFPTEGDQDPCRRAVAAARAIITAGRNLSVATGNGPQPVAFGLGLHVGEVAYGNVGSRTRLDFTVIGPAVNLASRLQALCATLGVPALATQAIADRLGERLEPLGSFALRGFAAPVPVLAV
ncbi:adenylate/guanylate cyclase domain-containing protein [Zavarzinia sp. CC-PAN008]|uniref:adenylate/guanylate cyclase domain-containing protein n=1 Tax=Zavarzinia sp. CC-PAN008 TaxID=3243332 RepID=UPI003F7484CC